MNIVLGLRCKRSFKPLSRRYGAIGPSRITSRSGIKRPRTGMRREPKTICGSAASFSHGLETKNGSMGFDFGGVYDVVNRHEAIDNTMEDGRRVDIAFVDQGNETKVVLKRSTRKAPIPSSSSKQASKRSWTIS